MRRGTETVVVLLLAFVVLPVAVLVAVGSVPVLLWLTLVAACACYVPAHRWSR